MAILEYNGKDRCWQLNSKQLCWAPVCSRLNIPTHIAPTKPQINPYYNLEYAIPAQAAYDQRLEGWLDFLQQFN